MKKHSIERIRKKIDKVDNRILRLIVKRYFLVKNIGKTKRIANEVVIDKDREKQILDRLIKASGETISNDYLESIYNAIFKASYRIEKEDK